MNEFEKKYLEIIAEETEQVELNCSTELVDQNEDSITNESLGKWAKNVFTKFGKKSVQKEMEKTFRSFCDIYKLERFDPDKPKTLGKMDKGYLITLKLKTENFKTANIILNVISPKSKRPVQDFKDVQIPIKHSNTEEEMADKINDKLSEIAVTITTKENPVPADFFETKKSEQQEKSSNEINNSHDEKRTDEVITKVAQASGFNKDIFKEKLRQVDVDKQQKISMIKSLISGWKKLDADERKLFQQLQK